MIHNCVVDVTDLYQVIQFLDEESAYWRRAAVGGEKSNCGLFPPEPPVGTSYWVDGELAFFRSRNGWTCYEREYVALGLRGDPTSWQALCDYFFNTTTVGWLSDRVVRKLHVGDV